MSGNKQAPSSGRDSRRSPVGNRKSKTPRAGKTKPLSNGLQEVIPDYNQHRGRSASLGKEEVLKMNLMTVRKLDTSVIRIESTVPQVVLYQYESTSNTWERTSVEGTLFIYERETAPKFGFVVLNKLHSGNTVECIHPGMEFRVQETFVLFKSVSKIYGLCFQELEICKKVGDLLNRLSSVTSHFAQGQTSVRNGPSSLRPGRSSSALTISDTKSDQQPPKVDVLDMLETAGRSYLGQTFSDGASSPDSLTSEPISFATGRVTTVAVSTVKHRDSTHFTNPTQHHTGTSNSRHSEGTAHTNYAREVPGVKVTSKARAVSVSPKKRAHSPLRSNQASSRRGQMHHANSFDHDLSGSGVSPNVTGSLQFSHYSRSFDHGNGIVRKLFSHTVGDPHYSDTSHTNFESNLSQSLNVQSSGSSVGSLPLRAISLDEVEKQMTAEVASPDSNIPFSLLSSTTSDTFAPLSQSTPQQTQQNVLFQPLIDSAVVLSHSVAVDSRTQPVSVSVKPPTPITIQNFPHTKPNVLSTPLLEHISTSNHSFPSIPPLMHSAGMKAAPITTNGSVAADTPKRPPSAGVFHTPSSLGQMPQRALSEPVFTHMHNGTPMRTPANLQHVLSPLPELLIPHNRTTSPTPVSSTLMSPQQFKHEQTEPERSVSSETVHTTKSVEDVGATVGLSRDQLLQAFDYLLKHDDHFVDQLYSAYKQSLSSKQ